MDTPPNIAARRRTLHQLHESGCFVIPNPWDRGSAVLLAQLGFKALATTSCGFAWTIGQRDNHVTLGEALAHVSAVATAVEVPVSADFEGGFAIDPQAVEVNVRAAAATPISGLSIEDSTPKPDLGLFEFALALERVRAARAAIDSDRSGVLLTARSEGFFVGRPDLRETIRRLVAYAEAGADCLYAPGMRNLDDIRTVVDAVKPAPVNVGVGSDFTTVAQLADLGVRRISVGGGLARAAWTGAIEAAKEIAERGTFAGLGRAIAFKELDERFPER